MSEKVETLILGAGLAGLSAAWHLKESALLVEARDTPGGTARALQLEGFHLDCGVHVLYFKDPWTLRWLDRDIGISLTRRERRSAVWLHGTEVPFPVQYHLGALPLRHRSRIAASALSAHIRRRAGKAHPSMAAWSEAHFGSALTREFQRPYNEKLWGVPFEEIATDWMQDYVPQPSLRGIAEGLLGRRTSRYGRNSSFWYPSDGGIGRVSQVLAQQVRRVRFGCSLSRLELEQRQAVFEDGSVIAYRTLISTIPLSELFRRLEPDRLGLRPLARPLRAAPVEIAHMCLPRPGVGAGLQWLYIPEPAVPFYRITFAHNIGPGTCPDGWSAVTLEFGSPSIGRDRLERSSRQALLRMGLLRDSEAETPIVWDRLQYGYVTYDNQRTPTVNRLLSELSRFDVRCIGRYGRWEYSNMEAALAQGRQVAIQLGSQK